MTEVGAYCCEMRRYIVIGIRGVAPDVPTPPDLMDYALEFHPIVRLGIKFCPWCGVKIDYSKQALRTVV
jgi:hypothetical protein